MSNPTALRLGAALAIIHKIEPALRAAGICASHWRGHRGYVLEVGNGYDILIATSEPQIDPAVPAHIAAIVARVWAEEERIAADDRATLTALAHA